MTINLQEFLKFGFQTDVIPTVVNADTMRHIFRVVSRERDEDDPSVTSSSLDFQYFKRALIRIAIQGVGTLGGE